MTREGRLLEVVSLEVAAENIRIVTGQESWRKTISDFRDAPVKLFV